MKIDAAWESRDAKYGAFRRGDLIGPYELLFPAAAGGMATVWAARLSGIRGFRQVVAVKLLSDALADDSEARTMLMDEARTAARIVHPNVGQVFDYGEARGRPFLAMEWIEGESLACIATAQQARGGPLPLGWVLHVAAAACAGLHAAHEAVDEAGEPLHVVHRDVTPQNVMVTFDGFAKVVDFGVAKSRRRAQITRVGVLKGKAGYFSPEQIASGEVDRRSDLFSFGVLLYMLVASRHPFRGRNPIETIDRIANSEPHAPKEFAPGIPEALDRLILRALAKKPGDRFQTAAELQRELERVAGLAGARIDGRQAGRMVEGLLPGVPERRRTRLAEAAAGLDGSASAGPPRCGVADDPGGRDRETVRAAPWAHAAGERRAPADTPTPGGTAVPSRRTARHAASGGRFGGLLALGLITAAALALRTAERVAWPDAPRAALGVSLRARAPEPTDLRAAAPAIRDQPAGGAGFDVRAAALPVRTAATPARRAPARSTTRRYVPDGI